MADPDKKSLRPAGGQKLHLIKASTWNQIRKLLALADLLPDPTQFETIERAGKKHFRLRLDPTSEASGGGGGGSSSDAFCTLYQTGADWFIKGGPVQAGTKNFSVEDFEVVVAVDNEWVVFISVNVEAYRDDDNDYFLSGIKTSSDTTIEMEWSTATNYPDNTDPPVSTGVGIIKLPVGRIVVDAGVPSFSPTACGGFVVTQCGGSLSHQRI